MKSKISDQIIDDYLMGKLSKQESEDFEIEVFGSPELLKEVQLREQMIGLIKNERETLISDYAKPQSNKAQTSLIESIIKFIKESERGWIYTGAVVVVLLIAFFLSPQFLQQNDIDLANFTENPRFESLLKSNIRSSETVISVTSPEIGQNFAADIVFKWQVKKNGLDFFGPVNLKIMNNNESITHTTKVIGGEYILEKLESGLYYWTIEDKGEMLYLGKFFVDKP